MLCLLGGSSVIILYLNLFLADLPSVHYVHVSFLSLPCYLLRVTLSGNLELLWFPGGIVVHIRDKTRCSLACLQF